MTNRKTLIRRLAGLLLPCHTAKRIYFHPELLGGFESEESSDNSSTVSSRGGSMLWEAPVPLSLGDIVWLLSDPGDSKIKTRIQNLCQDHPLWCTPKGSAGEDTWAHGGCTSCRQFEQKSNISFLSFNEPNAVSTPVSRPALDQTSKNRISELEEELQKLREQVAKLVMIQETSTTMSSMNGSQSSGRDTLPSGVSTLANCDSILPGDVPPPPPPPAGPPPPPPPPPPPVTPAAPKPNVIEMIKQAKAKKNGSTNSTPKSGPDMAEVLKGIGSVKLRAIKRSPGGTPIREKPLPCQTNDPAMIIAQALKRKFAGMHTYSPEKSPVKRLSPHSSTPPKIRSRRSLMKAKHLPMTDVH